jgi:peptidoglycan hydrolase CwlO-like protein
MEGSKKRRLLPLDVSTYIGFFDCVLKDYSSHHMPSDVIRSCLFPKLRTKDILALRRVCKRFFCIIQEEKWFLGFFQNAMDQKLENLKKEQKECRKFITSNKGKIARREQKLRSVQKELLELRQEMEEAEDAVEVIKDTQEEIKKSKKC